MLKVDIKKAALGGAARDNHLLKPNYRASLVLSSPTSRFFLPAMRRASSRPANRFEPRNGNLREKER